MDCFKSALDGEYKVFVVGTEQKASSDGENPDSIAQLVSDAEGLESLNEMQAQLIKALLSRLKKLQTEKN